LRGLAGGRRVARRAGRRALGGAGGLRLGCGAESQPFDNATDLFYLSGELVEARGRASGHFDKALERAVKLVGIHRRMLRTRIE